MKTQLRRSRLGSLFRCSWGVFCGPKEAVVIFPDVSATVGCTPLVELSRIANGLPARVLGKLEMRNPCGSVKDRVGVEFPELASASFPQC
jgi:hypothetical protein